MTAFYCFPCFLIILGSLIYWTFHYCYHIIGIIWADISIFVQFQWEVFCYSWVVCSTLSGCYSVIYCSPSCITCLYPVVQVLGFSISEHYAKTKSFNMTCPMFQTIILVLGDGLGWCIAAGCVTACLCLDFWSGRQGLFGGVLFYCDFFCCYFWWGNCRRLCGWGILRYRGCFIGNTLVCWTWTRIQELVCFLIYSLYSGMNVGYKVFTLVCEWRGIYLVNVCLLYTSDAADE